MTYKRSIFIFHRSIRLIDNIGLIRSLKQSNEVIPIFIFTPEQITSKNEFRSIGGIKFMIDALIDLDETLRSYGSKLYIFYGEQHKILDQLLKKVRDIEAVFANMDYTPYAIKREENLREVCETYDIEFESSQDYLLHNMNTVQTKSGGTYYSVFTPFYDAALKHKVDTPITLTSTIKTLFKRFITSSHKINFETTFDKIKHICSYDSVELYDFIASRAEAEKRLKLLANHKNYHDDRDTMSLETTRLSPYIKFGLLSVREIYHRILKLFGKNHDLIRQLYWREFYYQLSYNRPDILESSKSFRESYDNIKWIDDKSDLLEKWKNGKTGYPIVDAGMRELNVTGYMHNRARLITSNFLVKHLFIDWREGEKYFSSKLLDYDPSVNNGNWQFTSGSGADSQPFFRMMNPWTQGERHDVNCGYIKTWIPELVDVPNEDIHRWQDTCDQHINNGVKYPRPLKAYDFKKLKTLSKKIYSKAFN